MRGMLCVRAWTVLLMRLAQRVELHHRILHCAPSCNVAAQVPSTHMLPLVAAALHLLTPSRKPLPDTRTSPCFTSPTSALSLACSPPPGYCHISNVSDERVPKLEAAFKVGSSSVRCRVIGFRLVDGMATLSAKKAVVEQQVRTPARSEGRAGEAMLHLPPSLPSFVSHELKL